ncbi:hypothetical protein HRbin15_00436 [bacterium HR15]|nr:hypothetical protein HRbin15_00436 [bacterium HR15]
MRRIGLVGLACWGLVALLYGQRLVRIDGEGLGRDITGGGYIHISPNSQVVVTDFFVTTTWKSHPAIWTVRDRWWYLKADGGLTRNPREAIWGYAGDVSYDGSVVLGTELYGDPRNPSSRRFRWRRGVGIEYLPLPRGALRASAWLISWDGGWVVGKAEFPCPPGPCHKTVRWSPTGQPEVIEGLGGDPSNISASGREIMDACIFTTQHAFWREGWGIRCARPGAYLGVAWDGRVAMGSAIFFDHDPPLGAPARWFPDEDRYEMLVPARGSATVPTFDGRLTVVTLRGEDEWEPPLLYLWEEGRGLTIDINAAYADLLRNNPAIGASISPDGRYLDLVLASGAVAILDRFGIQGDVDGDDCVDDADLLMVLFRFGRGYSPEDVNVDGIVDEQDLLMVLSRFGECRE